MIENRLIYLRMSKTLNEVVVVAHEEVEKRLHVRRAVEFWRRISPDLFEPLRLRHKVGADDQACQIAVQFRQQHSMFTLEEKQAIEFIEIVVHMSRIMQIRPPCCVKSTILYEQPQGLLRSPCSHPTRSTKGVTAT